MDPPIIELEFEKDTLNPHIIIGGENIQLRIRNERDQLYLKDVYNLNCTAEVTENSAQTAEQLQEGRMQVCRRNFCLYCKNHTRHETRNIEGKQQSRAK